VIEYQLDNEIFKWNVVPDSNGLIRLSNGHFMYDVERYSLHNMEFTFPGDISGAEDDDVRAPQPGTVVNIKVSEGQHVNRGDYLLTIESMKLENIIVAVNTGVVKKIHIKAGDKVKKNEPLMHLQHNHINKV
jgi:biotin carboxyl carrier protein